MSDHHPTEPLPSTEPDPSERAAQWFLRGYNCAQATAAAFAPELGVDPRFILKLAAGFGGGMGGLRETCGAVSAMTLVAGLKCGDYPPDDRESKSALYALIQRMHGKFLERHQTACCKELLARASIEPHPEPSARTPEYYRTRPCLHFVVSAAEIVKEELWSIKRVKSSEPI